MKKYYIIGVAILCTVIVTLSVLSKKDMQEECFNRGGIEFEQRGQIGFCTLPRIEK